MSLTIAQMVHGGSRGPGFLPQVPLTFATALRVQRMDVESKARVARSMEDHAIRRHMEAVRIRTTPVEELRAQAAAIEAKLLADIRRWGSE